MMLTPRREFSSDEVAETEYLARPTPVTNDISCQVSHCLYLHVDDKLQLQYTFLPSTATLYGSYI